MSCLNVADLGVDGLIVENMWDAPYVTSSSSGGQPEVTAVMAVVCSAVRAVVRKEIPVGVQEWKINFRLQFDTRSIVYKGWLTRDEI